MIVRWGPARLSPILAEPGHSMPFVIATERWHSLIDVPTAGVWSEVPVERVRVSAGSDSLVAIGGGSALDTAKAASAATGLPLICVPTTYSGAEWPPSFGVRTAERRIVGGGTGAATVAILYDVELTLGLLPQSHRGDCDERTRPLRRGALREAERAK